MNTPVASVRELLEQIATGIGVDATIEVNEDDDGVTAEFIGEDLGLVIGHHGQTIDAIQHLAYRIAFRRCGAPVRVVVDAAGYRERRRETLETLAMRVAERVLESGQAEELEPMTAIERKVVHLRLKDAGGVATASEGTEPNRYVVVLPE